MARFSSTFPVVILAAAIVVAGVVGARQFQTPVDVTPVMPEPVLAPDGPVADRVKGVEPVELPALASLTETVARPVFNPSRRPAQSAPSEPEEAQVAANPALDAVDFKLVGLMRSDKSGARALIRHGSESGGDPQAAWFSEGDKIGGWTVQRVASDRVTLSQNAQRSELLLYARSAQAESGSE